MDSSTNFILTALLGLFVYYFFRSKPRPKNFPPGPPGIPIFGNAFQAGAEIHKFGIKMEPEYGPIIGYRNGAYWSVILNNLDDIRQAYNRPEFSGRYGYNPFLEENISDQTRGIVMSHGASWHELRKFSLKSLTEFGFGKRSIESSMHDELQELIEHQLRPNIGNPILNHDLFNASILNVTWALVAGERYKVGDQRLAELIHSMSRIFKTSFDGMKLFNFMLPFVVKFRNMLPFNLPDSTKADQQKLLAFLFKTIEEHKQSIEIGSPRDFIDCYLEERGKNKNSKILEDEEITVLSYVLFDLFAAATDTTSTTLSWAMFLLASHPEIQEKFFQEIHSVAGDRLVSLNDRARMPYTEAVMLEVHRMASLAPTAIPHATTEDVEFKGYRIPKNTLIHANLFACHFSKSTWGDPHNFRPERFISSVDGVPTFTKHPNVLPFSVGKRQCLGETTAKDKFFIFLTNIIQELKVIFPSDEPKHTLEGQRGLILTPVSHKIIFLER